MHGNCGSLGGRLGRPGHPVKNHLQLFYGLTPPTSPNPKPKPLSSLLCQDTTPSLTAAKEALGREWLPQAEQCHAARESYRAKEQSFIPECARSKYEDSCEKHCLEAQHKGCGVVEGNKYGAAHVRGGVTVPCAPPQPSWIMGPAGYADRESMELQCARLSQVQRPQFAQTVLKAGWLWIKGRTISSWGKHFAVLESSDPVRSAVLRFYSEDPSGNQNVSASAPAIILWDAKGVKMKDAVHYGFKTGEACFKLYHFYTDYRLCVPSGGADPQHERAEWMELFTSSMTFSDYE